MFIKIARRVALALPLIVALTSLARDYTLDFSGADALPAEQPVLRRAEMSVDVGALPDVAVGDRINLVLFGDVSFALKIVAAPPAGIAGQSLIAHDENGSASAVVKVSSNSARVFVDDFMNRRQYTVRCKDGKVLIVERDNSQVDDGECGTCGGEIEVPQPAVEETKTTSTKKSRTLLGASGNEFPLAAQKSVVDILVAFDQGAKEWAENGSNWDNGGDSIEEFADYAVNKMNTVLQNSQLDDKFCYRLVGVTEVDDSWKTINKELLGAMRTREGKFAKLSQLRERCGADTITLLIDRSNGTTTGIGFEYGNKYVTPSSFDALDYACNVCDIKTVHSRYTMSHETGHNMGCGHSNRQGSDSGPGRYSDSCGYHFTDSNNVKRSTVMAYTYTGDNDGYYDPVPYFSAPDITPAEYGCAVGVAGTNNNRRTLLQTYGDIAGLREHVKPYDWDVKVWEGDHEIIDGEFCEYSTYGDHTLTLTHTNSAAVIYYTLDGNAPDKLSKHVNSGGTITENLEDEKQLKICAVINDTVQSIRTLTLKEGIKWSGESGLNGNGRWSTDQSILAWGNNSTGPFEKWAAVIFPEIANANPTITVMDEIAPWATAFTAINTAYTFNKKDENSLLKLRDSNFAPAGDVTFNVPVQLSATTFTNMTGCALTFNAPFGQIVDASGGTFTGMVNIGPNGTLTVAPGSGKTQTIEKLNNIGWFAGTSTFRVGEGTVVFTGAINGGAGVIGRTKLEVGNGGELVFNMGGGTGFDMNQTSLTVEKGGVVRYNDMEHLKRVLYLDGGTIYAKRFDLMGNPGVYVTGDSSIVDNGGGYVLIRNSDSEVNVSEGKTFTLNLGTQTDNRTDTAGWGIIKRGKGKIVANAELKHSGVTDVEDGTLEVGYSSGSTVYGQGWIVASNATLRIKSGCALTVPSLTLDQTATLSLPGAASAPLSVNGNVNLEGVIISLHDIGDLSLGASYPLIAATGDISGIKSLVRESWPRPGIGLGWKVMVVNGTLTASIVNAAESDPYVDFMTNISGLLPSIPDDATMTADGALKIESLPIVIDGLATNAVGVTLDVTIGKPTAAERTICAWKIGSNLVRCVVTNGVLDCFWGSNNNVANSKPFVTLSPGRHLINIGYKSLSDDTYGGTFVYVDGTLAYRAAGLRWSSDKITKVTVGATAADTPDKPYTGLLVHNFALLDASSTTPLQGMTSSGGSVEYNYFAGKPPCVFALTPDGGFETYGAILSAAFSETYNAMSVSVVASFPSDSTGTVFSAAVKDSSGYAYATQVEYRGDGVLAFRDDGNSSFTATCKVSADMAFPHLYTMTYKMGVGFKLYMDGEEVLTNSEYFYGKSLPAWVRVVFGCGYWTDWMTSYNDNPNPMPNLKVYASHIALGTDDRTVSEEAVKEATGYEPEEPVEPDPDAPETPAAVDVLVAYDLGAQAYVSGKNQSLEEFAVVQIGKMNDVLVTNKLDRFYSYRLAGVCKVDGVYDNIDTAPALIAAGTGPAVSLRAAREIYGADTVTLLVDVSGNTLGNSSPLNSPNDVASQHECAFSVCSIRAVDTGKQHTMIHENAHNMGCGHARAQNIINSPFDYGRGYYFKDGNVTRHTIMAYGGDNDASWYFSTSSSEFGLTLGDATNDNARVLRETCAEVAKWREDGATALDGSFATSDATWQTSMKYPWSVDTGGVIRSYNQTEYGIQCTTPLKATVTGPAKLKFQHKSYFGGATLAGNNYSHFDVLLDDSPVLTQTECTNSWTDAVVEIPDGSHGVTFVFSQRFAMNNQNDYKDGSPEADDAVWLKGISITKKPVKTGDNFEVPGTEGWVFWGRGTAVDSWLEDQNFDLSYGDDMTWQEFMAEEGANGYPNWQNFMLGYSAEDPTQKFSAKIKIVGGKVIVETTEGVIPSGYGVVKRLFKKPSLDSAWDPPEGEVMPGKSATNDIGNSGFYKVEVSIEAE